MSDPLMSPRKQMAGGTSDGNFGVGKIGHPVPHPDRNMDSGKAMSDSARATGPTMARGAGMMGSQRNSDHGPHNHPAGKR